MPLQHGAWRKQHGNLEMLPFFVFFRENARRISRCKLKLFGEVEKEKGILFTVLLQDLELPTIFIPRLLSPVPARFIEPMSARFLDEILVISMQAFDQKCFREVNTEEATYWTLKHGNVSNISGILQESSPRNAGCILIFGTHIIFKSTHLILFFWLFSPGRQLGGTIRSLWLD